MLLPLWMAQGYMPAGTAVGARAKLEPPQDGTARHPT